MPTGFSVAGIVNESLSLIAAQTTINALNDGTPAAIAASTVYSPTVYLLLRELDPDCARTTAALVTNGTPATPWTYQYTYPTDCIRVRQVRPPAAGYDVNDPQPVRFNVGTALISAVQTQVILTNQVNALLVYTTSVIAQLPALWDAAFAEAVVRRMSNYLAMALSGRPDFATQLLEEANRVAQMAEAVDDTMVRPQ